MAEYIEREAAVSGYKELGRVVDKLTREKMISLHVKEVPTDGC